MRIGRKWLGGLVAGWIGAAMIGGGVGLVTCHADSPVDSANGPASKQAAEAEATLRTVPGD